MSMYGLEGHRRLGGITESLQRKRKQEVVRWQGELQQCCKALATLRKTAAADMTPLQLAQHQNRLHLEEKRRVVLTQKLNAAGVQVEKRGRPRKEPSEAYKQTHVKFTAMLKPENLDYLKCLKDSGGIDNISALLDSLIERHRAELAEETKEKFLLITLPPCPLEKKEQDAPVPTIEANCD